MSVWHGRSFNLLLILEVLVKKFFVFLCITLIIVVLLLRLLLIPLAGNPITKFIYAYKANEYLESKYSDDNFSIIRLDYDFKRERYYAVAKSELYDNIESFGVYFSSSDAGLVLSDNIQETVFNLQVEELYEVYCSELWNSDIDINYDPHNGLTITVRKNYTDNDISEIYQVIRKVKKDSIEFLRFWFSSSNSTTVFWLTKEQLDEINNRGDILKVCTPTTFYNQ